MLKIAVVAVAVGWAAMNFSDWQHARSAQGPAAQQIQVPVATTLYAQYAPPPAQLVSINDASIQMDTAPPQYSNDFGTLRAPAHIDAQVREGSAAANEALTLAPVLMAKMAQSVNQYGVAAIAMDDPALAPEKQKLERQISSSLRAFADALIVDMTKTVQQAQGQPATQR